MDSFHQQYQSFEKLWGKANAPKFFTELKNYSETYLRTALSRLPDGEFSENFQVAKQMVNVKLKVRGQSITIDFTGSSKQGNHGYHCFYSTTLSTCLWFFLSLAEDPIPLNSGLIHAFSLEAPTGSIVNPTGEAAGLYGYYETAPLISSALFKIYKKILKKEAEDKDYKNPLFFALHFKDQTLIESLGRGINAHPPYEGESAIKISVHNPESLSLEYIEKNFPVRVVSKGLLMAKSTKALKRGGQGVALVLNLLERCQFKLLNMDDHSFQIELFRQGDKITLSAAQIHKLEKDDTLHIRTSDGQSFGKKEEESEA
jgi:N-methylhydantoinase B/oxoprolinase/acetone carboxylase alpha subunit